MELTYKEKFDALITIQAGLLASGHYTIPPEDASESSMGLIGFNGGKHSVPEVLWAALTITDCTLERITEDENMEASK